MALLRKRNSKGLDSSSATRLGLETVLRLPSFIDSAADDKFISDEEPIKNGQGRPFVKLKRDHWVEPRLCNTCQKCLKNFGLTSKKFNCRRCGDIFCEKCCQYRRRLSPDANPSISGHYYRVCFNCSDLGNQQFGETRSLTEFFVKARESRRINARQELCRLVDGFKANVKASRLDSVMTETFSNIKVPIWQKSYKWLESKEVDWCTKCTAKFTIFMQKHHCRICGSVFCYKCCSQDLMLYYSVDSAAKWALIRVVGCPDSEPNVCLYLTVCALCHEDIEAIQVSAFYNENPNSYPGEEGFGKLQEIADKLRFYQSKVKTDLLTYQEMVEDLVAAREKLNERSQTGKSIVMLFAKLQTDLSDHFSQYASTVFELGKLKSLKEKNCKLLMNISSTFTNSYNTNMANFKVLKEALGKTIPASALTMLQDYCNKQAINCLQITTRRLGLEVLSLSSKYSLDSSLPLKIRELDEICLNELQVFIEAVGENWAEHRGVLDNLVKDMFKSNKMIVPSQRLIAERGISYLKSFLRGRSVEVLQQAERQLLSKSSETKFTKSKEGLTSLTAWLQTSS